MQQRKNHQDSPEIISSGVGKEFFPYLLPDRSHWPPKQTSNHLINKQMASGQSADLAGSVRWSMIIPGPKTYRVMRVIYAPQTCHYPLGLAFIIWSDQTNSLPRTRPGWLRVIGLSSTPGEQDERLLMENLYYYSLTIIFTFLQSQKMCSIIYSFLINTFFSSSKIFLASEN